MKKQKRDGKKFYALTLIVTFVSFLGFAVENVWMLMSAGYIDNRNMYLPLLFGYGLAVLAIYFLFGTTHNPRFLLKKMNIPDIRARRAVYFALVLVCICVGESAFGYLVEWTCGVKWWGYEHIPLHLGRYTSIPTSCIFTLMILIFMDLAFDRMYGFLMRMNPSLLRWISLSALGLMTADFVNSGLYMLKRRDLLHKWKIKIFEKGILRALAPK